MPNKALAPDRHGDFWWVDTRRLIEEEGFNRRERYGNIPKLAADIKAAGLDILDPLFCYKKGENWVILKGHRRARALKILEEQEGKILMVRIIPAPKGFNKEKLIADQIGGNDGLEFTVWEKAKVVRDLRALGWSETSSVQYTGLSLVYVRALLTLADAPQKLINLVQEDRLRGTEAIKAIAEGKIEEVIEFAEQNPGPLSTQEQDMFPVEKTLVISPRITRSKLQGPASFKKVNKWIAQVDEENLSPEKAQVLKFLKDWKEGKVDEKYCKKFFR